MPAENRVSCFGKIVCSALCLYVITFCPSLTRESWPLQPEEVLVVANAKVPASVKLADYYMKKRRIPPGNLILLSLTEQERCGKEEYFQQIVTPIRLFFALRKPSHSSYRCLVSVYGIPLTVREPRVGMRGMLDILFLKAKRLAFRLSEVLFSAFHRKSPDELVAKVKRIDEQILFLQRTEDISAVDSEIALVHRHDVPFSSRIVNPLSLAHAPLKDIDGKKSILMVSRLDGPTPAVVRRMIDDSLKAERQGLMGTAYFDARWPDAGDNPVDGYAWYDRSLHRAARHIGSVSAMNVTLDESDQLFQGKENHPAALYCGWYSPGKYMDAFHWVPGAIGYHLASFECQSLRDPKSNAWCKSILTAGAAATIGPVDEPFLQAFPPPDVFFALLLSGRYTLAECFALSNPFLAWRMVLIGDPLYRPFKMPSSPRSTLPLSCFQQLQEGVDPGRRLAF